MDTTQNLQLPFILAAQAQKHVTHNEAMEVLDALVQLAVEDRDLANPPAAPSEGQRFIVAGNAGGDWSGHAGQIAARQNGAWTFCSPQEGWLCFVRDEDRLLVWTGTAWVDTAALISALQNLSLLGLGTAADATNPVSAKLNNVLWTAKPVSEGGDGSLRYKMSKESAAKTLSLLMQTNYSGRAEIGLTGDDKLHVKVSADGSTWSEALVIDPATGNIGVKTATPGALYLLDIGDGTGVRYARVNGGNGVNQGAAIVLAGGGNNIGSFGNYSALFGGSYNAAFTIFSNNSMVLVPDSATKVGIRKASPTCALDVADAIRVGSFAKAALPSPSSYGAGAMIYVSDEIGGAVIAFSDGTAWRRVTDRAVVG